MKDTKTKEHIARIAKASTYFIFRNGPVSKLHKDMLSDFAYTLAFP